MTYPAASIANAFLSKSFESKTPISPMKIQKLLYFTHGYCLALLRKPAVNELFEAWKFGPVLPSLYQECKGYKSGNINEYLHDYDFITFERTPAPFPDDSQINEIIDFVWNTYGKVDAVKLSNLTHETGGPWDQVISQAGGFMYRNQDIDNDLIKKYFLENTADPDENKTH